VDIEKEFEEKCPEIVSAELMYSFEYLEILRF
jgi:hypothetical protein